MKRILSILLLLLLVVGLCACGEESELDGMMNVSTANAKFDLYVPEGWISQTEGGVCGALAPTGDANVVATTQMLDTAYDKVDDFFKEKCLPEYKAYLPEFTLVEAECGEAIMGGMNAYKYVFTVKKGESSYKYQQVIVIDNNLVYTVQYTADASVYANYLEDVASIVSNFALR